VLTVAEVERSAEFFRAVGMREVESSTDVAIMELRGGTHLVLVPGPVTAGDAPFDLMVEDLNEIHREWTEKGLEPGAISQDRVHESFVVTDPDGHRLTIRNSHVVGEV